jgi:hypothetical protein
MVSWSLHIEVENDADLSAWLPVEFFERSELETG